MSSRRHRRKRRTSRASCERKIHYPSRRAALAAQRAMWANQFARLHAYRCGWGDHWHLGH